jgi:glycosyltransferase involved in cell wall biosynthesis
MHILHLDSGREMRGGQWQVLRLLEGLRREGVGCTLLCRRGSPLWEKARAVHPDVRPDVRPLRPWAVYRLSRQADLVHAHDAHTHALAAALSPALNRVPLVVSRRVAFPIRSRWKYRHATRYAAVSQFVKGILMEGGVAEDNISVIYDGVPLGEPAAGGEFRLNTVMAPASGDPRKGTALALEATRRAGVDLFLSRDLETDLASAGLFLYLTQSEGLGSAILMAMAAGVPVVASNVGGIPEIVRHRENGWLAENEPETIAAAIRELRSDTALAGRLAARARQTVAEKFSVDQMIHNTIHLYRQVLAC